MRERRTRRERYARPPDPLARLFLEVSGEPPDDTSLLRMRRVSAALNLRDNDALWSVLAALGYYVRLYEAIPERVRQAGAGGVDAARAEAQAATQTLMAQHRDALARCKETITLAERLTAEHEARYRAALAALNDEALAALTQRAANRIARVAGNRLVAATAVVAREQRQRRGFQLPGRGSQYTRGAHGDSGTAELRRAERRDRPIGRHIMVDHQQRELTRRTN